MSVISLVEGTCAGLEWTGAQDQVEYPFAVYLAWAMDRWITSGLWGGGTENGQGCWLMSRRSAWICSRSASSPQTTNHQDQATTVPEGLTG